MAGRKEWRVQTSFRELILRAGSGLPQGGGVDRAGEALLSHLIFALRGHHSEVASTLRDVRDTAYGYRDADPAPPHFARPPYWRELDDVERDLRAALRSGMLTLEEIARRPGVAVAIEEEAPPPPARPAQLVAQIASYDVNVIDDTGAPVAGIDINLTVDGAPETLTTSGGGTAHSEGTSGSAAALKMLDVSGLPAKLEAKWSKPRAPKLPTGPDVAEVPAGQPFDPLSVRANKPFTLILARPPVRRVRMVGMLFDANKCFLLPQALPGILTAVGLHQEHPAAKVLIIGHAGGDEDLAGADIAVDRANIVSAYLTNKPDEWLAWFKKDKPARSRWGTREVQLMLSALPSGGPPFYEGTASGVTDAKTRAATKAFQASQGLTQDGKASDATLRALVAAYLGLEDTTLAQDIVPVTHGCEGHFDDDLTTDGLQADDRRLEVFFFDWEIKPEPPGKTSQAGSPEYPAWRSALVETRDFEHHGIHVQIIDNKKRPVPLAQVHLEGPVSADALADDYGFVSFFGLTVGNYTLSAQKAGIKVGTYKISYPTAKTVPGYAKPKKAKAGAAKVG